MKKLFYITMIIMVTITFESCKDNSLNSENTYRTPVKVNVPLKIGNKWSYLVTQYAPNGSELSTDTCNEEIVRDTLIEGKLWFIRRSSDSYAVWEIILRNENKTLLQYNEEYRSIETILKYPPFDSDKFEVSGHLPIDGHDTTFAYYVKIDTLGTIIPVQKGEFYCCKYYNDHFTFSWSYKTGSAAVEVYPTESFYSDIGLIKTLIYGINSNKNKYLSTKMELINYTIK